jgi:putative flippase GtrA
MIKPFFTKSALRQFLTYVAMGGAATGVDWLSFYSFNMLLGLSYLSAVILSFSLGAVTNYFLNKFITFKDKTRQIVAQMGVYAFICVLSLLCSIGLMYALVEWAKLWPMLARIITTGIMLLLNFLVHKFVTYNQRTYMRLLNRSHKEEKRFDGGK